MKKKAVILSCFGPAGSGKTLFAANLAATIAQGKNFVWLLDLDQDHCGDIFSVFRKSEEKSLAEIDPKNIDERILSRLAVPYSPHLQLVQAYRDKAQAAYFTPQHVLRFLEEAAKNSPFIVIDCGSRVTPSLIQAFELSTAIFLVTQADVLLLNHTIQALRDLNSLLLPKEMILLILNRYQKEATISPQTIRNQLQKEIFAAIGDDPQTVQQSVLKGTPFVISHSKTMISQYFFQLIRTIQEKRILEQLQLSSAAKDLQRPLAAPSEVKKVEEQPLPSEEKLDRITAIKRILHGKLTSELDLKKLDTETSGDSKKMALLREKTKTAILKIIEKEKISFANRDEMNLVIKEVLDEALALGPLEELIDDPSVTEIMVNRRDQIYVEREGKIQLTSYRFTSDEDLRRIIDRIVLTVGRRVDENSPYCDARLLDGSRVHAIIPPLSIQGPMLTIRKFAKKPLGIQDLIRLGSLNQEMATLLAKAIRERSNILISGGTGTGKTTLLNVLSSFISEHERIITIEDAAELQLQQPHVGRLEARPPNIEGKGEITIRDLVRNSLRMRPDRILVGECRGKEALDMLQAMNTGHDGSLTTIHSNSPRDCLSRLETLVLMADQNLPVKVIREQISSAINIIVQISRFSDGSRKITDITEITGMEGDRILLRDIFLYKDGKFVFQGFEPEFLKKRGLRVA